MSQVDDIVAAARSQIGVAFSLGRAYDGRAIDCVGLLRVVAARCNITLNPTPDYALSARSLLTLDAHDLMVATGFVPKKGPACASDIVRLEMRQGLAIHFGIVTGNCLVHACFRQKIVVEDWFINCTDACVRGIYSWPNSLSAPEQ